jgi:hypothetical protein
VSLNDWEDQALRAISAELSCSAPELASRLSLFNRLASGEQLPEHLRAAAPRGSRRHRARPRRAARPGLGSRERGARARFVLARTWLSRPVVAVVLAGTFVVLVTLGVALGATGHSSAGTAHTAGTAGRCSLPFPAVCGGK